jgi:hypothetical protein
MSRDMTDERVRGAAHEYYDITARRVTSRG